ncbi:MAG: hypothetical protein NTW87_10215, partial [Planctomycetota bacterium]|nr:hypothetical protein [Planctomycetota bacterium]
MRKHLGILAALLLVAGVLFSSRAEAANANPTLVVNVSVTIKKNVYIQWGAATAPVDDGTPALDHSKDPDRTTAYSWTAKNPNPAGSAQLDPGDVCTSSDAANGKT